MSGNAIPASRSTGSPLSMCRPSPISARSQPTPTAPGPNWPHIWGSTAASWSSSSVVPSASGVSVTVSQDIIDPYSQVTAKDSGASQRSTTPPALPSTW